METMKYDYDSRHDTLYVAFAPKNNSYGDDSQAGIILMRDIETDDITGFTILSFLKKWKSQSLPKLPESLNISLEDDILPLLLSN